MKATRKPYIQPKAELVDANVAEWFLLTGSQRVVSGYAIDNFEHDDEMIINIKEESLWTQYEDTEGFLEID